MVAGTPNLKNQATTLATIRKSPPLLCVVVDELERARELGVALSDFPLFSPLPPPHHSPSLTSVTCSHTAHARARK